MKKFIYPIICFVMCILVACFLPASAACKGQNTAKVIAADKYYSIIGKAPTCVKYNIYDRNGNTVFSETTDRPVKITRNGDNVIDIAKGIGTGITAHRFYNTEENAFSETFYGVISSSDRLVAFIDVDR